MSLDLWLAFAAASFVLAVIPGPSVTLIVHRSLAFGARKGLASVAGTAAGTVIAFAAALGGVGALLLASAFLFTALKWAGALYLIWLGVMAVRGAEKADMGDAGAPDKSIGALAAEAFLVASLNPKTILFFVAFAPLFLDPAAALPPQFAAMIATFVVIAAASDSCYALLAATLAPVLRRRGVRAWTQRVGGGILMAGGALILAARRN